MGLTDEQKSVVQSSLDNKLTLVNSVAGSGKSHTLISVAEAHNNYKTRYLVFSREQMIESKMRFNKNVIISTNDAMNFRYVVTLGLEMDNSTKTLKKTTDMVGIEQTTKRDFEPRFNLSQIKEDIPKRDKEKVKFWLEEYCKSRYLSVEDYCETEPKAMKRMELIKKYMNLMASKKIPACFDFNRKYMQILTHYNLIDFNLNLLMVDEFQDLNPCTLEIVSNMKVNRKVFVGDKDQLLFGFAGAIDGFKYLSHLEATRINLTKSFRVPVEISKKIELFGKLYLDPDFTFVGTDGGILNDTTAYLSRTNSTLIQKMVELHKTGTPYRLTRKPNDIFSAVRTIMYLSKKGVDSNSQYSFLNRGIEDYFEGKTTAMSLFEHIKKEFSYHVEIQSAMGIVSSMGNKALEKVIKEAIANYKKPEYQTAKTLCATSYTLKGKTLGVVHINKDVLPKDKLLDLAIEERTIEETQQFNNMYVAFSRCNGSQDTTLLDYAIQYKLNQGKR